jgi:hypothetical protein
MRIEDTVLSKKVVAVCGAFLFKSAGGQGSG